MLYVYRFGLRGCLGGNDVRISRCDMSYAFGRKLPRGSRYGMHRGGVSREIND